jgi:hypothetical protein
VGTPCTRRRYNYCNRSCNSKSSEATIITIPLTDKVQPNIFVMVSHRVSCWPVKALQQSPFLATNTRQTHECVYPNVPLVCIAKALNAVGGNDIARCWEMLECFASPRGLNTTGRADDKQSTAKVKCCSSPLRKFAFSHVSVVRWNYDYVAEVVALIRKNIERSNRARSSTLAQYLRG